MPDTRRLVAAAAAARARRGALHVLQLWHAPEAEKLLITPGGAFYAANRAVELSNWRVASLSLAFCFRAPLRSRRPRHPRPLTAPAPAARRAFATYMCYDLAHVLAVYPRLGGMATVFHHSSFALAALVAGVSRAFSFAFGWRVAARRAAACARAACSEASCPQPGLTRDTLRSACVRRLILCEASTPFLNLRWLFKCAAPRRAAHALAALARSALRTNPLRPLPEPCRSASPQRCRAPPPRWATARRPG
jgi:hypothetical protein